LFGRNYFIERLLKVLRIIGRLNFLGRFNDPRNPSVTLLTLRRAAAAVGRKLSVELS
jgi:hypothetical protein